MKNQLASALLALSALSTTALAASVPVAIIDSGTDYKHSQLQAKMWMNPGDTEDGADNDGNGYADDIRGWNFAENNKDVIDYQYLGKFSKDVYRFFELQLKLLKGEATEEEKEWMKKMRADENFLAELQKFGNFVHGTHVANIASRGSETPAAVMAAKLIPTEVKAPKLPTPASASRLDSSLGNPIQDMLIKMALGQLASQQSKLLTSVGQYTGATGMRVANCSFGTSKAAVKGMLAGLLKPILQRDPTPEELDTYSGYLVEQILQKGAAFATSAPKTLFVIAAGNDAADNDKDAIFPANLGLENTLTVAATYGTLKLASFSNYGRTKVDVAAPGVGILASIPGETTLVLSGTSQASPFVANAAVQVLGANPGLTHKDVKALLMQTVDFKDYLKEKVVSGGIVNPERARRAAALLSKLALKDAVLQARLEVADQTLGVAGEGLSAASDLEGAYEGEVLPLPSLF